MIQNLYDDNIFYGETVSKFEYLPILKGNGSKNLTINTIIEKQFIKQQFSMKINHNLSKYSFNN